MRKQKKMKDNTHKIQQINKGFFLTKRQVNVIAYTFRLSLPLQNKRRKQKQG
jgi:hypothetical protein